MNAGNLNAIGAGFNNEALGSQAVFRTALDALSRPGRWSPIARDAQTPATSNPAAAALLLALLDADCTLWASPALAASPAMAWLRFHTGCQPVADIERAQFAWIGAGDAVPALSDFSWGTDAYPDAACTLVIELDAPPHSTPTPAQTMLCATLTGPGIAQSQRVDLAGLPADFSAQWALAHAAFPRGVDIFLAQGDSILGLPRTTAIVPLTEPNPQGA